MVVAAVVAETLALFARIAFTRKLVPSIRFRRDLVDRATAKRLVSFGAWTSLGNLAYMLRNGSDAILLNHFSTPVQVTACYVGSIPVRQVDSTITIFTGPLQPVMTAMHATGDTDRLKRTYVRGCRIYLWIALAVAFPLIALAPEVIGLYAKEQYTVAGPVMALFLAGFPLTYSSAMLYRVALARARVQTLFASAATIEVVRVILVAILLAVWEVGALGVAAGTLAVTVVGNFAVYWPMAWRMVPIPASEFLRKVVYPGVAPFLAGLVVCFAAARLFAVESWFDVGAVVAVGAAVYLAILFLFGFQDADRDDLRDLMRKIRGRGASTPSEG